MTKQQIKSIISELYNLKIKSIRSLYVQKKKKYNQSKQLSKTHYKKVIVRFEGDPGLNFF